MNVFDGFKDGGYFLAEPRRLWGTGGRAFEDSDYSAKKPASRSERSGSGESRGICSLVFWWLHVVPLCLFTTNEHEEDRN